MAFRFFFKSLVLLLLAGAARTVNPQTVQPSPTPEDEVIRVSTNLVTVPVAVKDRKGKTILDLRQQDFHLYEDGVEQPIAYFDGPQRANESARQISPGRQRPLTVAVLLDVSDSTELKLQAIKDSAIAFVEKLAPEDQVVLTVFDENVRTIAGPHDNRQTVRAQIEKLRTGRGTSVYDAVDSITTWLAKISGRKVIVLLTDGVDTASQKGTYLGTIAAAEHLDATIYPIQFNTYADFADSPSREGAVGGLPTAHMTKNGELASEAYQRATRYLRELAEKTGGQFEYSDSAKNLARSFEHVAERVRDEYTLGFYPADQSKKGRRQLTVRLDIPEASARTRKTYVLKPASK